MAAASTGRVGERLAVPLADRTRDLPAPPAPSGPADAPDVAVDAARDALARGETHYTDRPGIGPLRALVARRLGGVGFAVDAAHVLITCGVEEARFVVVQQTLDEGDTAAAADPTPIAGAVALRGARTVALGEPARVAFAPAAEGTGAALRASVGETGWIVLELPDAQGALELPEGAGHRSIVIGSLGAADGLASWRIGYLACAADAYTRLRDFKQALTICTTNLSQWAALAWLETR